MGKLDHNLDAYRLAAAALERLRSLIRRHLEAAHGAAWEAVAIPDDPREFLAQRRARESSVKWNPSSSTDLLDFAGFLNLHEVLVTHPRLRDSFARLAPEPHTLRLRFLELDTVLNRIAYARPVSESDMELLLGFDERLRQLVSDLAAAAETADLDAPAPAKAEPKRAAKHAEHPAPPTPDPASPPRSTAPVERAAPAPPPPREPEPPPERAAEPREKQSRAQTGAAPAPVKSAPAAGKAQGDGTGATKDLETALKRGDDRVVLATLYQEITGLAEKLWSDSASAHAPVWDVVCESSWYRERFSVLRLRVVSNFYDLLRAVHERRANGSSRNELHEFLKERNFAQLLMELREFFRPLLAPAKPGQPG
jgi:hypothetical protein